tara:strand:+ start:383 stop:664 length:282 start_codon:yes stop_codon:yes gene_type:complete
MEQNNLHEDFIKLLTQEHSDEVMDTLTVDIVEVLENLNLSEGHSVALASILLKHSIGLYRSFLSNEEIVALLEFARDTIDTVEPHFVANRTLN